MKPFLFLLHFSLQNFTSSQFFSHFLRQVNGRPQTKQIFVGRCRFLFIGTELFEINQLTAPND
jgi:hypothetical protein